MENRKGITSFTLRIMAMIFMICDHLWATLSPGNDWLTMIGRLTFPIFAFLTAEGYCHTGSYEKYLRRMILWAVISEIPFNLMYIGSWIYPFHQNVLWTFVLALLCMRSVDRLREKYRTIGLWILSALAIFGYFLAGKLLMVDYSGEGILMVLVFHFLKGTDWKSRLGQLLVLYYINWEMMKGLMIPVEAFGFSGEIPRQGTAILALFLIWSCNGRRGHHSKIWQIICYAFYPAHMLLLVLIQWFL